MLKIKEWKYDEMMHKVCRYGDKWMEFDSWERDENNFDTVIVDSFGYVHYYGRYEIEKETEKAMKINFNCGSWHEWIPKHAIEIEGH